MEPSTAIGATRVGIQIATAYKSPQIEVYFQFVDRRISTGVISKSKGLHNENTTSQKEWTEIFQIEFYIVNIGGKTASEVDILVSGSLQTKEEGLPENHYHVQSRIAMLPPGQIFPFLTIDGDDIRDGSGGLLKDNIVVDYKYNPAKGDLIGSVRKKLPFARATKEHIYSGVYEFSPNMLSFLPSTEYVV